MTLNPEFFGHMFQGDLIPHPEEVTIPFGTYRCWNNGASYEWVDKNNWEGFDLALRFAKAKQVKLLYTMFGEDTSMLPDLASWRAFVTEAVARAQGQVAIWQPFNEPVYYAGATPEQVMAYQGEAEALIKGSGLVLSPSFNELQQPYAKDFAQRCINLGAALGYPWDALAFHSYSGDPEADRQVLLGLLAPHNAAFDLYLTETVIDEAGLKAMAAADVRCVVQNAQLKGHDDHDASTMQGQLWTQAYGRLMAPAPERTGCLAKLKLWR